MFRWFQLWSVFFVLGATSGLVTGCENSCVELSKKVCRCKPTDAQKQACIQRVENDAEVEAPSEAEQENCEKAIDGCNCKKLAAGNLEACGLATESP